MSKKKVLEFYPDAEIISSWENGKDVYQVVYYSESNCTELSHVCSSRNSAWRSAVAWIEGRKSKKKGEKTGQKAKISILLPQADKARIERKHGTVQAFVNHYASIVR